MASPVGDAARAREQAQLLRLSAELTDQTCGSLTGSLAALSWQGNRAARFRTDSAALCSQLRSAVALLGQAGDELRAYAEWVEETEAHLRRVEASVRRWASEHPVGSGAGVSPDASSIPGWPGALEPAWDVLAARLRRLGATF